jgi:hypothetical protein
MQIDGTGAPTARCAAPMTGKNILRTALAALLLAFTPVAVAAPVEPIEVRAEKLKAGGHIWQPELATEGPVEIVIGIAEQRAYVFRGGALIGAASISSGIKGRESPIGRFQILEKKRFHRSNRYSNAPMPWMQRLNWYGIALHAGEVTGRPASHGCFRLPAAFAQKLFGVTELGGFVFVTEDRIATAEAALKLARANVNAPYGPGRTFESAPGRRKTAEAAASSGS